MGGGTGTGTGAPVILGEYLAREIARRCRGHFDLSAEVGVNFRDGGHLYEIEVHPFEYGEPAPFIGMRFAVAHREPKKKEEPAHITVWPFSAEPQIAVNTPNVIPYLGSIDFMRQKYASVQSYLHSIATRTEPAGCLEHRWVIDPKRLLFSLPRHAAEEICASAGIESIFKK